MSTKICRLSGAEFEVEDRDLAFYERVSPSFSGRRYEIPPPTLCPEMRLRRRLSFRNQIYLFTRPSSTSGKTIFSLFPEDASFPVIDHTEWWSDSWDALQHGRDFDFSRPFFEQFMALRNSVPHPGRPGVNFDNSDFCANGANLKNCYLLFNSAHCEECSFCETTWHSVNCMECTDLRKSELCYDCTACTNCYALQSSQYCENCSSSYFLLNCRGCSDCFGCVNLRRKQYCFFNKQLTKDEYFERLQALELASYRERSAIEEKVLAFWKQHPRPHAIYRQVEDVTGNSIAEAKNVHDSYFVEQAEDVRFGFLLSDGAHDCYDLTVPGIKAERIYEGLQVGINAYNVCFSWFCADGCSNLFYCDYSVGAKNCFGCSGIKHKEYCIFNKQYSKQEYEALSSKIAEHMINTREWGEFYPAEHSPVPYNYTLAARYFPLSKQQAQQQGLRWLEKPSIQSADAIAADQLPDISTEQKDTCIVRSRSSDRAFKISSFEL
ncbi:MAG: hypothetical protein DCC75_11335, partial [Proteobacteria bacterium]